MTDPAVTGVEREAVDTGPLGDRIGTEGAPTTRRPKQRKGRNGGPAARGGTLPPLRLPSVRRLAGEVGEEEAEARATSRPIREGGSTTESSERDARHRRLLATADAAAAGFAVTTAIFAAGDTPTWVVLAMMPLMVLVSKVIGLYERDEHVLHKTTLDEMPALLNVAIAGTLLVWMFNDWISSEPFNRPQVALLFGLLLVSMGLTRMLARRAALASTATERLLVLGSGPEAQRIKENLSRVAPLKAKVIGRVPATHEPHAERGEDVLGIMADLDYVLARGRIDRVVICPHGERPSDMLETIRLVKELGVKVSVVPRLFEVVGTSVEFDHLGGLTLLGIRRYELSKSSAALKRAFDVFGAGAALIALAPLFAVVALTVKATSRGPVFFRQRRVGRAGAVFSMFKFRTMYAGADGKKATLLDRNEADGFFKIADDPRITPVGRLLRRTAIDELPQLINVLRGEMSLVGPRPLVDEEDARIEGSFRRRLDVTPGMTGAWQVLGASRIPMRDMVTIDYLYRTNWSLWVDIKILLRTVPYVLRRQGL